MALLLASLLAVLATGARAQFITNVQTVGILGLNHSLEYNWVSDLPKGVSPNDLPDPLYASPRSCVTNKGVRGLTFDRCVALCSLMTSCKVVAYYAGDEFTSECFAYGTSNTTFLNATSSAPVALDVKKNQTAYIGVKISGLGRDNYKNFLWANATAAKDISLPPTITVSPLDCNGTTDTGIPDLNIEECINVCLAIPDCLMMKYYAATADASSQCFQYAQVANELFGSGNLPSPGVTRKFVPYDTDKMAYLGWNRDRFQANSS